MNSNQTDIGSQVSEVFDGGNATRLTSTATSYASDLNLKSQPKKSPQPGKAKQVMGMDFATKPLSPVGSGRKVSEDGNIAALENEYSDVLSQKDSPGTSAEPSPSREKSISMDEDRIKETARDIYNGTELLVPFSEAASWLMSSHEFNSRVRVAYMELYDFMGVDLLNAVRYISNMFLMIDDFVDVYSSKVRVKSWIVS
jgi:hypothetical protein